MQGTPEKLTQEQVLEELGVKIETKGKKSQHKIVFFSFSTLTQCTMLENYAKCRI